MRLDEKGEQFRAQFTAEPESVYWEKAQAVLVLQAFTALSQLEDPTLVQ
jgi:hypothetical protein